MAFQFLENTIGQIAGQPYYPTKWDPIKGVLTDNPNVPGYTLGGKLKASKPIYATPIGASQTAAPLPPIFSGLSSPAPTAQAAAGSSPVYPLNVPTGPGVSTISVPKSDNVAAAAKTGFEDLLKLGETQSKVNAEVKAMFPQWFADQQATAATENAATKGVFTGEEQAKVNSDVANFLTQANAANAKSIADVQRLTSRSALASDASGYSSARDRGRFATIADINAKAGRDAAVAQMQGDQWLTQLQQSMAGAQTARQRLAFGDVALPATMQAQQQAAFANILGSLSQSELSNLLNGLVGPGGYVGESFGGLQAAKLQDLSRISGDLIAADNSALNWANLNQRSRAPIILPVANTQTTRDAFYNSMLTPRR